MKTTRTLFAVLMLSFAFTWIGTQKAEAQACNFGSNVIPCPNFVLGQENVPFSFGTFNGNEEWSAIGKAPFPVPSGDTPYGIRLQLDNNSAGKGAGSLDEMRGAELFQNVPNPFNQETRINYYLPETVQNASMIVFDMSGRQVRNMDITNKGKGTLTIGATDLEAGMYIYSLIADGKEIASKRMILTK